MLLDEWSGGTPRNVIIIGGGASGVLLACHLLRDRDCDLRVTIVEKRPDVGRGIAYSTANPDHLLNVRVANMSAFPDDPDHFWRWLWEREGHDGSVAGQRCDDPFCFVPRRIYGDYIAGLLSPLLAESPKRLRIIRGECDSIDEAPSGIAVSLTDGSGCRGDIAVLATGHEVPSNDDAGCYLDPWVAPADAGVTLDTRILVLGTGLTMIDYVLSLILAGHVGLIVAMSRRGLLPNAHRSVQPVTIKAAQIPFGAGITTLIRWLRTLIDRHVAAGGDWRSVVDGLRPFTQKIWQELPMTARRSFLEHARPWWDVLRHRMAPEVETRIKARIADGGLTVMAAKLCAVEQHPQGAVVRYRRRGANVVETLRVDKIVDCRGVGPVPLRLTNPALRSLFQRGLARLDPLQMGIDVTQDCAIVNQQGAPSNRLFAIGPLTRAAFWEIIAVPDIRTQCMKLARHIKGVGTTVA
jgi:uncharacterized NAD(P)/FAD-binding protein YdhS